MRDDKVIEYYAHPELPEKIFFRHEASDFFTAGTMSHMCSSINNEMINEKIVKALHPEIEEEVRSALADKTAEEKKNLQPQINYSTFTFFILLNLFIGVEMTAQSIYDAWFNFKTKIIQNIAGVTQQRLSYANVLAMFVIAGSMLLSVFSVQKVYAISERVTAIEAKVVRTNQSLNDVAVALDQLANTLANVSTERQELTDSLRLMIEDSKEQKRINAGLIDTISNQNAKIAALVQSTNAQKIQIARLRNHH